MKNVIRNMKQDIEATEVVFTFFNSTIVCFTWIGLNGLCFLFLIQLLWASRGMLGISGILQQIVYFAVLGTIILLSMVLIIMGIVVYLIRIRSFIGYIIDKLEGSFLEELIDEIPMLSTGLFFGILAYFGFLFFLIIKPIADAIDF